MYISICIYVRIWCDPVLPSLCSCFLSPQSWNSGCVLPSRRRALGRTQHAEDTLWMGDLTWHEYEWWFIGFCGLLCPKLLLISKQMVDSVCESMPSDFNRQLKSPHLKQVSWHLALKKDPPWTFWVGLDGPKHSRHSYGIAPTPW